MSDSNRSRSDEQEEVDSYD